MTMRMEAVPEEPGRRDQTLDAGAETVVALHRLARAALTYDPSNQAFVRELERTHQALVDYCARVGRFFSAFFAPAATFVSGELLRGPRSTQDAAAELGNMLEARGIAEISITKEVFPEDLLDFSRLISNGTPFASARIRVRGVDDVARVRGLVVEHLPVDRRIARLYGEAVVSMRGLFDELLAGRHLLPPRIKRIAHALVDLAASQNPFFVGVTETFHPQADEAVRAVHAAILAAAMTRELGAAREKSVEVVLSALLHDAALPRIRARAVEQTGRTGEEPEADHELPAGTAASLATFVGLHQASMPRMVIAFESQWHRFTGVVGPLYRGARPATLQSRIVAAAHDWARLRLAEGSGKPRTIDDTVAAFLEDRQDASELAVARLLVATLRFYPSGTVVELDSGEIAEVIGSGNVGFGLPVVRVTIDKAGVPLPRPQELDLQNDRSVSRRIVRVRSIEGWRRLERSTTPAEPTRPQLAEVPESPRASLPSISPGILEGLDQKEGNEFIQVVRSELSDQLADVVPREKSSPSIDDIPRPSITRATESVPSKPRSSTGPHARGTLSTTPLVHVLIYVLDHGITGSIELKEPDGVSHIIYVRKGAPVKVKSGRLLAPLAELLVQAGRLAPERIPDLVASAEKAGVLTGEYLITQGLITRGQLWTTLELQIPLKLERLANLPVETTYFLYRDVNMLERYGGADAVAADPVHVIHSVVRRWHDRQRLRATLNRIAKHPLIVRADAKIAGLKLTPEERAILDAMRSERATLGVLSHMRLADAETLHSLVYTLAITRQLDLPSQKKAAPMGLRSASLPAPPPRHTAPPGSGGAVSSSRRESAGPKIAEAIATALSRPPSGGRPAAEVAAIPQQPSIAEAPSVLTATAVPVSSAASSAAVPPVSSSRERMIDSAKASARTPGSGRPAGGVASVTGASPTLKREAASDDLDAADRALQAMSSFRQAETALIKGDFLTAERLATEAFELDPEPVDYRAMIAWVRAHSQPPESLTAFVGAMTDLLVEHPDHPRVLLYRARLLKRQGRMREAASDYEAHLRTSPKSKDAIAELKALRGG